MVPVQRMAEYGDLLVKGFLRVTFGGLINTVGFPVPQSRW